MERTRLKTAVADLTLDNLILKERHQRETSKHRANKEMCSAYAAKAGNIRAKSLQSTWSVTFGAET